MKIAPKFTAIFIAMFGIMLVVAGVLCYSYLQQNARAEVLGQAQLMMEAAAAMRHYTDKQIKPLVGTRRSKEFHAQWVPAYAATQVFSYLREKYPAYTYKEATLNPTNLSDRADPWEATVVNTFRATPAVLSFTGERDTPEGKSLYLAHPIVVDASCLECHSVPEAAPRPMLYQYGRQNGFGWQLNEVVGAQIVSVPAGVSSRLAESALHALITSLMCFALITLIVLNIVLAAVVIRPLARITAAANDLTDGKGDAGDVSISGRDELATLAGAFNRLRDNVLWARRNR
jgi:methyl-accepting chemotaxis protein